jgi:hypothetical protein
MSRNAAWMGETVGLVSKEYAQHNTDKLDSPPQGIARLRPLHVGFLRAVGREVVDLVSTGYGGGTTNAIRLTDGYDAIFRRSNAPNFKMSSSCSVKWWVSDAETNIC